VPDRSPFRYQRADDSPGFLLWQLTALWQDRVATALEPVRLTQTQYAILASLRWFDEHGEQPTQRHLVDHTKIDKMTVSKALRKLEGSGLVSRQRAAHDARATEVRFTPQGRRTTAEAIRAVEDADETLFAGLDLTHRQAWMTVTNALITRNASKVGSTSR
jgi:DNA-binding MarR family transcriptional regulator